MAKSLIASLAVALVVVSCKKDEPQPAPSPPPSAAASAAVTAAASAAPSAAPPADSAEANVRPPDTDKLPTAGEQQTQASKSVSRANYKSELDAVEKELKGIK